MIKWLLQTMVKGSSSMGQKGGAPPALNSNDSRSISNSLTDELSKILDKSLNSRELNILSDRMKGLLTGMNRVSSPETLRDLEKTASALGNRYFHTFYKEEERVVRQLKTKQPMVSELDVRTAFRNKYREPDLPESSEAISKNSNHHMRQFGLAMLGYVVQQIIQSYTQYQTASMMTHAGIERSSGLAFNYNSLPGDYILKSQTRMQNEMSLVELEKQRKMMLYGSVGSGIGMAVGTGVGFLSGGMFSPTLAAVGGFLGNTIGTSIADIGGTQDVTRKMHEQNPQMQLNKLMEQWYGLAGSRVEAFGTYDVANARTQARFGNIGLTGKGLGYDDATLKRLQYQMGSISGYDKTSFLSQTGFSRAEGLSPEEVYQANISTRYTGQKIGPTELMQRKNLAQNIGMSERLPEVIQGMNQLAEVFAKVGNKTGESGMMKSAALLSTIYGDSEKGRIGTSLGMNTFGQLQGMFQQAPGSAGDAFMFNALRGQHKGNLRQFEILKEQGLTNPDTFRSVLQQIEKYGPEKGYFAFKGLGLSAVNANQLSEKIKTTTGGVEGVMKEWEEKNNAIEKNTGDSKNVLDRILIDAQGSTSKTDKFQTDITNSLIQTGGYLFGIYTSLKAAEIHRQNAMLNDASLQSKITSELARTKDDILTMMKQILGDAAGFDPKSAEGDFLYNFLQPVGSKERDTYAGNLFIKKENEGLFETFNQKNAPKDYKSDTTLSIPIEFDSNGVPTMWTMIRSGYHLDNGETFNIGSFKEKQAMQATVKSISGGKIEAQGKGMTNNFNISLDPNNIDGAMHEIRSKIQQQVALMAKPYKRK
jgi:hypothetical protein